MMRFALILILGCAPLCLGEPSKDVPKKELPQSVQPEGLPPKDTQAPDEDYDEFISEWGFIRHMDTGMIVYLENDNCSVEGTPLKVGYNKGKGPLEVRFGSIPNRHFGMFKTRCGTYLAPEHLKYNAEIMIFRMGIPHYIDEESNQILCFVNDINRVRHRFTLFGESANPMDGAKLVTTHDGNSRFQFVPNVGPITAFYPTPQLSGEWFKSGEVIVTEPGLSYPYEIRYDVGRSVFRTGDYARTWRPSPARAFEWFRKSEFSYYACRSESVTWGVAQSRKEFFEVSFGFNVFYRWRFISRQNDDAIEFKSSIIIALKARDAVPQTMHLDEDTFFC